MFYFNEAHNVAKSCSSGLCLASQVFINIHKQKEASSHSWVGLLGHGLPGGCVVFCVVSVFVFLGPHLRHMKVPRLGVTSELQLPAYTTAHSSAGSLIWWARPGIEPTSAWILVMFVTTEPRQELLYSCSLGQWEESQARITGEG